MALGALAGFGLATTALGAVTGAVGSASTGNAQAGMYNYRAGMAGINKQISLQNADYERSVGEVGAFQSGLKSRNQAGKIITTQAAGGLDVTSGSNAAVQDSQARIASTDQTMIRSNAAKRAYNYEVDAANQESEMNLYRSSAENAKRAGRIGAISSILGGASSVASKWYQGKSVGV